MTVKELIEKLQTQDLDARAVVRGRPWGPDGDWDWDDLTEVRTPGRYDSLYGLNPGDKAVILE